MTPCRIAVVGATGRMGRAVTDLVAELPEFEVVCAATRNLDAIAGSGADAVIDFSAPSLTDAVGRAVVKANAAWVNGTTGLDAFGRAAIEEAARHVPVLWEPNMSFGVFVLGDLLRRAIELLDPSFDIEIVETHHRRKVDAPSGTALKLAAIAQKARGDQTHLSFGRQGQVGERNPDDIAVHAVRGGDVFGDHTVHLLGNGERLELTYRATGREVWARGALRAAKGLVGKKPGVYHIGDVA